VLVAHAIKKNGDNENKARRKLPQEEGKNGGHLTWTMAKHFSARQLIFFAKMLK